MSLELVIVTPQGEAYRGPVERVVLPGSEGDFGEQMKAFVKRVEEATHKRLLDMYTQNGGR